MCLIRVGVKLQDSGPPETGLENPLSFQALRSLAYMLLSAQAAYRVSARISVDCADDGNLHHANCVSV